MPLDRARDGPQHRANGRKKRFPRPRFLDGDPSSPPTSSCVSGRFIGYRVVHCFRWIALRHESSWSAKYRFATSPKVTAATGSAGGEARAASRSSPPAMRTRASAASSRARRSETPRTDPKPISRRLPFMRQSMIQLFAPLALMVEIEAAAIGMPPGLNECLDPSSGEPVDLVPHRRTTIAVGTDG
jgi:hypothetical protein